MNSILYVNACDGLGLLGLVWVWLGFTGHVERMDEYRMARRVLMAEVIGGRVRGRPRLGWMDGVKVALGNR